MQSPGRPAGRDPNSIVTHVNHHTNDTAEKKRNFLFVNAKLAGSGIDQSGSQQEPKEEKKKQRSFHAAFDERAT
jgi:hypothetical protein